MSDASDNVNSLKDAGDEAVEDQPVCEELGEEDMDQLAGGSLTLNAEGVARSAPRTIAAFPDVCLTPPTPGGPVPIPYPNTDQASDTSKGTKTTK